MSKIFDVLRKDNLLELSEFELDVESAVPAEPTLVPEIPPSPSTPLFSSGDAHRVERLRVSALAPLFPFEDVHYAAAEQYRIIRTKIHHHPKKPGVILVSSASSGDGKTVTSINIAASLALRDDSTVLLIDADMRRPRIAHALGIADAPGLSEVLSGRASLAEALIKAEQFPNLSILTAGAVEDNPAELLDSDRWRQLVEEARTRFTNVIFDTTPVATVTDYELVQVICDGVIVVARPDHTGRAGCAKVLQTVPKEKLLGVVLNCVEDWWLWKTPAYEYYRKSPSERNAGAQNKPGRGWRWKFRSLSR